MALRGALGSGFAWARVTPRHFAWQAWHNLISTFVSRGRCGTNSHLPSFRVAGVAVMALRGALGSGMGARDAAAFCVAGVAQPYIHLRLRGRRGTNSHLPSFHVAGVAQSDVHLRFAWQAWHSWHSVARLGLVWARVTPRHFVWQVWHNLTSTFVSHGKCGTNSHLPSFRVAGVALMAWGGTLGPDLSPVTLRLFAWQAWDLVTSTIISRGRRGTNFHEVPIRLLAWTERSVCGTAAQWSFWIGSFGNPHVSEKHIAEDSVPHVSRLNVSIWL